MGLHIVDICYVYIGVYNNKNNDLVFLLHVQQTETVFFFGSEFTIDVTTVRISRSRPPSRAFNIRLKYRAGYLLNIHCTNLETDFNYTSSVIKIPCSGNPDTLRLRRNN